MSVSEYAVIYLGKPGSRAGGAVVGGGNALLGSPQHALDGPEHLAASDLTRLDASTAAHGLMPKLSGDADDLMDGTGAFRAERTGLPLGLTGAVQPTRYAGATTSGAPTAGTFAVGDFVIDLTPAVWVCTAAGSPGTWAALSGGASAYASLTDVDVTGVANGDLMAWDAASSKWLPAGAPSGTVPSGTALGDLLVWDGSAWSPLAVGADTDSLTADSTQALGVKWAAPGGGSGALVLLEQHTASSSATLDFTSFISSTYDEYEIHFVDLVPATNSVELRWRAGTGAGPTYDTGSNYASASGYIYPNATGADGGGSGSADHAMLGGSIGNDANYGYSGTMRLFDPGGAKYKRATHAVGFQHASVGSMGQHGSGVYKSATAMTAIRFYFSSGNIASGTIRVYGIAK